MKASSEKLQGGQCSVCVRVRARLRAHTHKHRCFEAGDASRGKRQVMCKAMGRPELENLTSFYNWTKHSKFTAE